MWFVEYAGGLLTCCRLAVSSDEQLKLVKNCLLKHFEYNLSVFVLTILYSLQFKSSLVCCI